jgi:hypothetical protein
MHEICGLNATWKMWRLGQGLGWFVYGTRSDPAQLKNIIRQEEARQRQAVNRYNAEVRKHNAEVKRAIDSHNTEVRKSQQDAERQNRAARQELDKYNREVRAHDARAERTGSAFSEK